MDKTYIHLFKADSGQQTDFAPVSNMTLSAVDSTQGGTFADGVRSTATSKAIEKLALNPLNSATGGLATRGYRLGRNIMKGASAAAIGSAATSLAIAAAFVAIEKLQKRVDKMEAKAAQMNDRDNILIRAGAKDFTTDYKGTLFGVREKNNRS